MSVLYVLGGVALSGYGLWLTVIQARALSRGAPNTLGGTSGLLISGIVCIVCGIIIISQHL